MPDTYDSIANTLTSPAIDAHAVTPDDESGLPHVSRALYVGASGDVAVELVSGTIVTFRAVAASVTLPVRARKVLASGTSAADILALW